MVWSTLFKTFKEDKNDFIYKLALGPVIGMSLFNAAMMADGIGNFMKFFFMELTDDNHDEIEDAAQQATRILSPTATSDMKCFGRLSSSQKSWAKVRGAVLMGAVKKKKDP